MEYKVYREKEENNTVILQLKACSDGDGVVLRAVDKNGELLPRGNILWINSEGVHRTMGISEKFGFEMDSGYIKMVV